MLERTAGCLESGSLQRLIPGSQKRLKSRRMLHSSFWSHGAADFGVSPIWQVLLRDPDSEDSPNGKISAPIASSPAKAFLDFLYPSGALKVISQYACWKPEINDGQRLRARFSRLEQRLYTSLANATQYDPSGRPVFLAGIDVKDDAQQPQDTPQTLSPVVLSSESIIEIERIDDFDEVWQKFENLNAQDQQRLIPDFLRYMSTSCRLIDAERSILLFQNIRGVPDQELQKLLMQTHINLGNVQEAITLHHEMLAKFDTPVASDILLAHLIDTSQCQLACKVWSAFQRFRCERPCLNYNIWTAVDSLADLPDRAIEVASFAKSEIGNRPGTATNSKASQFASFFISRVLLVMADAGSFEPSKLNILLKYLQLWNGDTPERYQHLISKLLESGHSKQAIQIYRRYRQRTTKKISRPILDEVLKVACKHNSVLAMQQLLDDWFRFYKRPSGAAYRLCMGAFARQGDVSTVKTLFDQYISTRKQNSKVVISTADDLSPLLHVHAKRGEVSEVLKIFNSMEKNYGVKPNIKSWNILLAAYGNVHDVDGAFHRFQNLLDSSIKPDGYTIGTMMGICTTRGDLEESLELYQMAETMAIPRSTAMVDCLVLGHIQDDQLIQAEKICEDALDMELEGSLTRMWNYLLTAYAMRRDLESANRILRRMRDNGVKYDESTYSALMQALAMVKQPDRANEILNNVMPEAGIRATSFHYAILMGGYIATSELHKVFLMHRQMLKRHIKETGSTRSMLLRARAMDDQGLTDPGYQKAQLKNADRLSGESYCSTDVQEIAGLKRKGTCRQPLDVAYPSAYYSYLIYVLGQRNDIRQAKQLYNEFMQTLSEERLDETPLNVLSALMAINLKERAYDRVQEAWTLVFEEARKKGQPIGISVSNITRKVLPLHQLALTIPLSTQIMSLASQEKYDELVTTIGAVEEAGFRLDNKNWNIYIQCLAESFKFKEAFELCEVKLMDGWTGWAKLRWMEPQRNRLPAEVRRLRKRKTPPYLRPLYQTLLNLAKVYVALEDTALESEHAQATLDDLEQRCSRTIQAIRVMPRMADL